MCYSLKTGALFAAGLQMTGSIANLADLSTLQTLAYNLGIAFQHQDDLLEVITVTDIGKSKSSDENRNKSTLISYMSVEESIAYVDAMFNKIYEVINSFNLKSNHFLDLIKSISKRNI